MTSPRPTAEVGTRVVHRRYVPYSHAHYAGNLVDGAYSLGLFGDVATEMCIRTDGDEGLFASYSDVQFRAPVRAGDVLEITCELTGSAPGPASSTSRCTSWGAAPRPRSAPARPRCSPSRSSPPPRPVPSWSPADRPDPPGSAPGRRVLARHAGKCAKSVRFSSPENPSVTCGFTCSRRSSDG